MRARRGRYAPQRANGTKAAAAVSRVSRIAFARLRSCVALPAIYLRFARAADAAKVTRASGNPRWRGFPARLLPNDRDVRWRERGLGWVETGDPVEGSIRVEGVNLRGGNEDKVRTRASRYVPE